jgi:hypothetical protein
VHGAAAMNVADIDHFVVRTLDGKVLITIPMSTAPTSTAPMPTMPM